MRKLIKNKVFFNNLIYLLRTYAPFKIFFYYIKFSLNSNVADLYAHSFRQLIADRIKNLNLSKDWTTINLNYWIPLFEKLNFKSDYHLKILEIGCWEGLTSYFFASYFHNSQLTCVDTWRGSDEHKDPRLQNRGYLDAIETKFNNNVSPFSDRIIKYKGASHDFFYQLKENNKFDIIYIDGSHYCNDVMIDAIKAFENLKVGGLLIFDDYLWSYYPNILENSAAAINLFLKMKRDMYRLEQVSHQLIITKTKESKTLPY